MKQVFLNFAARFPLAMPADYIKISFQSRYGTGHLIPDRQEAGKRLYEEWQGVRDMRPQPDFCLGRYALVSLKGLNKRILPAVKRGFMAAAEPLPGAESRFLSGLRLMVSMAGRGFFAFDGRRAALRADSYLSGGIRPQSHSRRFHQAYAPAYRVVDRAVYARCLKRLSKGE